MKVTAVIFDMDGTVLNTLEDLTDAVNAMRRHFDLEPHSIEQVRHNVGNGVEVLMEKSLPGGRDDPRFDEALAFYRAYYESHNQIKTAPYPGILPLMDELKKRGVAMAVVSNKQDAAVKPLSRHFFGDRMALSMGPVPPLRRKPNPDMAWAAVEQLGKEREECLFVGDSEVDVMTAKNAGLTCAAVTWGFRERNFLESLNPDYIIGRPEELLKLL